MLRLMKVADVLNLPSIEYDFTGQSADMCSAADVIETIDLDGYHDEIRDQMIIDGINAVPIHVASPEVIAIDYCEESFALVPSALAMGNGHHRLKMMDELGLEWVLTTDDITESGEADDPVAKLVEEMTQ